MDASRIEAIQNDLFAMEVKLEEDPASVPPGYIQQKVAVCARHSSYLSNLMMEVNKALAGAERIVELLKAQVEIRYSEALMHDPEINRVKRTATNRSALAKLIVASDMKELAERKAQAIDLKYLLDSCKRKERELKIVDQAIRLQARVLGLELDNSKKNQNLEPEDEDDDVFKRGDGTPVVHIEQVPGADPLEGAAVVPTRELDVDSLVSGMEYDVPEVEGAAKIDVDECLEKLG